MRAQATRATFFTFGLLQGTAIVLCAWFLRAPAGALGHSTKVVQSRRDYTLAEALQTPVFWVMLAMFTGTVTGGLMAVAQLSVIAQDLGVREIEVNVYFFAMAALPFALMLDRVMNGISRPFFGWISDYIGRESTMFIAFSLEGLGILALGWFGHYPWAFVILSGVVFLAWGEVYSLFSATAGDTFGTKHIGKIYGVLYCAKGIAALLVPLGNVLMERTGSWATVLYTMSAMDLCSAVYGHSDPQTAHQAPPCADRGGSRVSHDIGRTEVGPRRRLSEPKGTTPSVPGVIPRLATTAAPANTPPMTANARMPPG